MKINEKNKFKKFLTLSLKYDIIYMYLSDTKKLLKGSQPIARKINR